MNGKLPTVGVGFFVKSSAFTGISNPEELNPLKLYQPKTPNLNMFYSSLVNNIHTKRTYMYMYFNINNT